MTPKTKELLERLRACKEACVVTDPDGSKWANVYLPNVQGAMSRQSFGGRLAILKKAGYYRPSSEDFGDVKLEVAP